MEQCLNEIIVANDLLLSTSLRVSFTDHFSHSERGSIGQLINVHCKCPTFNSGRVLLFRATTSRVIGSMLRRFNEPRRGSPKQEL